MCIKEAVAAEMWSVSELTEATQIACDKGEEVEWHQRHGDERRELKHSPVGRTVKVNFSTCVETDVI
jgi:hypothetical protein